ncbi:hypothetical protein R1sor_014396 [Riccia sorocarpa]|uniref:Uncharacterized protein n=1 Tax=Riccia sorocarpa TaxID=122646 RepID=A0ABD3HBU2_9MARC
MKSANTPASGGITGKGVLPVPLTILTRDSMVANTTSQQVWEKGVTMAHYGSGNSAQNNNPLSSNRQTAPVVPMNDKNNIQPRVESFSQARNSTPKWSSDILLGKERNEPGVKPSGDSTRRNADFD